MKKTVAVAGKVLEYSMQNCWGSGFIPKLTHNVNVTRYWCGSDSEENFKKNPKPGYDQTSIVYKFNSHGYRTKEFEFNSDKKSIICIGCSFTYGTGINVEDSWPSHIERAFPEYNVYNLGVPGSSGDTIARILTNIENLLNPAMILILWPEIHRYEIYNENKIMDVSSKDKNAYTPTILIDSHFEALKQKNQAIISLLKDKFNYAVFEHSTRTLPIHVDNARDNHPGPQSHRAIAQVFLNTVMDTNIV